MHTAVCVGPLSGEKKGIAQYLKRAARGRSPQPNACLLLTTGATERLVFYSEGRALHLLVVWWKAAEGEAVWPAGRGSRPIPMKQISPLPFLRTLAARAERRHKDNSMSKRPREEASEESSDAAVAAPSVAPADTSADAAAIATGESHSSSQGSQGSRGISS